METSARVSAIASSLMTFDIDRFKAIAENKPDAPSIGTFCNHVRTLAGSALTQDETPGQDPLDFVGRLKRERKELHNKAEALSNFIDRGFSEGVNPDQRELLKAQLSSMNAYLAILDMRLTKHSEDETPHRSKPALDPEFGEPVEVGGHDEDRDGPIPFDDTIDSPGGSR